MSPIVEPMLTADHLLTVVDAYREARGISDSRVSALLFNDGKRIRLIREGGDIGSRHLAHAFRWLSDHWPDQAPWPEGVTRPPKAEAARADEAVPEATTAAAANSSLTDEVPVSVGCRSNGGFRPGATGTQSR